MAILVTKLTRSCCGSRKLVIVNDDYTMDENDDVVLVDTQMGEPTITLPVAKYCIGKRLLIQNSGNASNDTNPGTFNIACQAGDDVLPGGFMPITGFSGRQEFIAVMTGWFAGE